MSRRISGFYGWRGARRATPAPYVDVGLGPGGRPQTVPFLIDTGADITTLGPRDALTLLGRAYLSMDFEPGRGRLEMIGVGREIARAVVTSAEATFYDDEGSEIRVTLPLAFAEPIPPDPGPHGNWQMPSLLGRDVLQHFDLSLSYHPPSVALTEASESS